MIGQLTRGARDRRDRLERRQAEQRDGRDKHGVERSARPRPHGCGQDGRRRKAGRQRHQRVGQAGPDGIAPGQRCQLPVELRDRLGAWPGCAEGDDLRCGPQQLDQLGRQLRTSGRQAGGRLAAPACGQRGHRQPGDCQAGRQDRARRRQHHGRRDDAQHGHCEAAQRRAQPAHVEPVQPVDVADHAGDQVAAAEAVQLAGGERLDPREEARPDRAQRPQRQIVGHQPVDVARQRTGQAEEPHDHDGHGQRQHRRPLRRARDQVAGGRDQRDAEGGGHCAQGDHHSQAPPRNARELNQPADHDAAACSCTMRSARDASSSSCAITSTVRPCRQRSTAARTSSALAGSRLAVGSSRISSGASRSRARARAIRCVSPADSGSAAVSHRRLVSGRQLRDELGGTGRLGGVTHQLVRRFRCAQPDVVGDRAVKQCRMLRQPRDPSPPELRVAGGDVRAAGQDPPVAGLRQPQQQARDRALSAAAGADQRDRLSGRQLEPDLLERRPAGPRIAEADPVEADGGCGRDRQRRGEGCGRRRGRVQQPPGHRHPVRPCVELGRQVAQRQVQLGRQQQHRQRRLESDVTVHQPHSHGDRDQRHSQRGRQIEHRAGQKGKAQRLHGRLAVALADLVDALRLGLAAVEGTQRRQAAHDVEEVRREQRQLLPARQRPALGGAADQPHEDRHQGQRDQHQQRRQRVDRGHQQQHRRRHHRGQHHLRQRAREHRLEGVDARHRRHGQLGIVLRIESGGGVAQPAPDQIAAKRAQHVGCGQPPDHVESP